MATTKSAEDSTAAVAPDLLRWRARHHPDRAALRVGSGTPLTFSTWEERSNAAAHALLARGVRRGERVGLLFGQEDWVAYAIAYLGAMKAAATAVHLGSDLPRRELRRRLAECGVTGIVHADATPPEGFGGWTAPVSALDGADTAPPDLELDPADVADVLYTSGTTGPAKAFTNPHGTLTFRRGPAGLAKLDMSAPLLAPMPMGTPSSAMCVGMMPLNSPATVVLCRPGDAEAIAALAAEHRVATLLLTPWIALRMAQARVGDRHDLSSVTTVAVASASLPASAARALHEMMPSMTIRTAYAQGEAVPAAILGTFDPERPTALGRPAPGTDLRVADEQGAPVPDGELGEIWLRSGAPKRLYLDEARNRQVHGDGWTRTRDLGYVGADGDLYLFDRMVDVIETAGERVSSIEVEQVLHDHPGVREAAVVGVPDARLGQAVVAVAVLARGTTPEDVHDFARSSLAEHQVPAVVPRARRLPRGVTGKVLKYRLRRALAGGARR